MSKSSEKLLKFRLLFMMSPGIVLFLALIHLAIDWTGMIKYYLVLHREIRENQIEQAITLPDQTDLNQKYTFEGVEMTFC